MKNIDVKEIIAVMDELEKERGISKDYLVAALEEALVKAYKQNSRWKLKASTGTIFYSK